MYRGRPWTIRQYAGFASAEETNERFRYLLERGQTGLSVAFDLPTQLGYDSDDPVAAGEVGRTGVAIDSIADMEILLAGIPLDEVSTSMTINAPASLLLLLYELVAEEQGVPGDQLRGTVQNDILKEYIARGNYIFPPRPSMRLTTDLFAYCADRIPGWNTISISGYHIREAGSTAAQELAFTLANGIAYCEAALAAGLSVDDFGARLSFFFNAHNHVFQEVAKFRAARRLWASLMRDRFGATNPKAQALRFHAQTGRLDADGAAAREQRRPRRRPGALGRAAAAPSRCTRTASTRRSRCRPSDRRAIALRTQQILAHEAGVTDTADPLGGSWFVESLTAELEERARELIDRIDDLGGAVAAIEAGWVQGEIEDAAFRYTQRGRVRRARDRRRQPLRRGRAGARSSCSGSTRRRSAASSSGRRASAPSGTPTRRRPRSPTCGASPRPRRTSSPAHARGAPRALHDRRDLRRAARPLGHVRRPARLRRAERSRPCLDCSGADPARLADVPGAERTRSRRRSSPTSSARSRRAATSSSARSSTGAAAERGTSRSRATSSRRAPVPTRTSCTRTSSCRPGSSPRSRPALRSSSRPTARTSRTRGRSAVVRAATRLWPAAPHPSSPSRTGCDASSRRSVPAARGKTEVIDCGVDLDALRAAQPGAARTRRVAARRHRLPLRRRR